MTSLAEWYETFGDEDYTAPDKGRAHFQIKTGVCYPITIRGASLCKSQLGEIQIAIDMDIKDELGGKTVAYNKDWISLPFQPVTDMGKEKDTVATLTRIRRNTLSSLLCAIDPPKYQLGRHEDVDGGRVWHSYKDDHVMQPQEIEDRKVECNREILRYAKECHAMLEETETCSLEGWSGTELYFSKKENERNPKYPYSRYHTEPAFGIPLYSPA